MNLIYSYCLKTIDMCKKSTHAQQKDVDGLEPLVTTAFDNCRSSIIFHLCQNVLSTSFCKLFTKFFLFNTSSHSTSAPSNGRTSRAHLTENAAKYFTFWAVVSRHGKRVSGYWKKSEWRIPHKFNLDKWIDSITIFNPYTANNISNLWNFKIFFIQRFLIRTEFLAIIIYQKM
jgi:hypothetical protein